MNRPRTLVSLSICAAIVASVAPVPPQSLIAGVPAGALDYQPLSDSFVVLARRSPSGSGFETISMEGIRFRLGAASGWPEDAPVAVIQDGNDFQDGHVFTSRGAAGRIVQLSEKGAVIGDPWVTLPGETGPVTALASSHGAPFGDDLIVGTMSGNLWRINAAAQSSFIAATGYPIRA